MSKKKILQLRSSIGFFGAENMIAELAMGLNSTKYKPIIGVLRNHKNPHLELVDFARKNNIESAVFECQSKFDLKAILSIRNFIKKNNVDIVQTHGYKSNFYTVFATLSENVPLVATCHPWIRTSRRGKVYAKIDKFLLRKFDRIVAISEEVKQQILNAGIAGNKISIIDNGISVRRFEKQSDTEKIRKQFGVPLNSKVIGTVGRLASEKGHFVLLEAAAMIIKKYPSTFFIIVGDGLLKDKLESRARHLKIDNYLLLPGLINDIPKLLSIFDIFVLPSLAEGLPMALLEAMAARKPIVATSVGNIPSAIVHNETGLLVNPNDVNQLENAITYLLKNDDIANRLAGSAYLKVKKEFSSEQMALEYTKIYNRIMEHMN